MPNNFPTISEYAVKIGPGTAGGPQLDLSGVANPDIHVRSAKLTPEDRTYDFESKGNTGTRRVMVGESNTLNLALFLNNVDLRLSAAKLHAIESRVDGLNRACLVNPYANDLVPSSTNKVYAGRFVFPRFDMLGGEMNAPVAFDYAAPGDGAVEELVTPFAAPSDGAAGNPSTTTLDITFTAVVTQLAHIDAYRYQRFDIYQAETSGAQDFSAAPAASVVNDGTAAVTEVITGLTTATQYFYVIEAVGYFDVEAARSAEFSGTTS